MITFGQKLKDIRKRQGFSQTALGNAVGVSKRVISYYEREGKYPPAKLLQKMTGALNVSADDLLGATSPKGIDERTVDGKLLQKFRSLQKLSPTKKKAVFHVLDAFLAEGQSNERRKARSHRHA